MGKIGDYFAQGSGFPSDTYAPPVMYPWAAVLNNLKPDTTPDFNNYKDFGGNSSTFNVWDKVYAASSEVAGSPYEHVTAYSPDDFVAHIKDALDDLRQSIDDYDADTLDDAVTQAAARVDELMGEDNIPALVASYRTRQDTAYNRDVSALYAGLWEGGAIVGTQTWAAAAMMKNERTKQVNEYELQMQVNRQGQRTQLVSQLLSTAMNVAMQKMQVRQSLIGSEIDAMRYVVTAKQDQQDKDLEYITKDSTYDLDLMAYATNAMGSIYGAQVQPRQQTKGERLLAAITGSLATGIQGGMALHSPAAGVGLGAFNLFSQLALTPL